MELPQRSARSSQWIVVVEPERRRWFAAAKEQLRAATEWK